VVDPLSAAALLWQITRRAAGNRTEGGGEVWGLSSEGSEPTRLWLRGRRWTLNAGSYSECLVWHGSPVCRE
jgi:hypothetical protein